MLKHLTIKNYALIKELELIPSHGLNVITGETGAGKSIMLGALGLVMGNRADTKVLWNDAEKCVTEATFDIREYKLKSFFKREELDYEDLTLLRREISPGGKSRAFINDTPVTLDVMKRLGGLLMDIHSQHETLLLGHQHFQLSLIDAYAGTQKIVEEYDACWTAFVQAKKNFERLSEQASTLREEADYINFQLDELNKANLEIGEQTKLEDQVKVIDHSEEIKTRIQQVLTLLDRSEYATGNSISEAISQLHSISSLGQVYELLQGRLESVRIELSDIISELEHAEEQVDFDPEQAELIKERLSNIYRLQKKHRVNDIESLLHIQKELTEKAAITSDIDGALTKANKQLTDATLELKKTGSTLSKARVKVLQPLTEEITSLLKILGIPEAKIAIDHLPIEPQINGMDEVKILFSANKGIAPQPLQQVASGGEFSRLMFSIKYVMATKTAMPTLILDEIDSGISGEIAMKLGALMKTMAKKHQLISITHLPQIAAKGETHYFVYKDSTSSKAMSKVRLLNEDERILEIAQMIGGEKPSPVSMANAKELLS